jgi:hypothetical protein
MADVADLSPPELMFKLIAGFWVSQAIGVAADLALADRLAEKPATADELAEATGAEPSALLRLLRALTTVGVFCREDGGRFALTPLGGALRSDVPGSMREMAIAQTAPGHWLPWGRLGDAVRTGTRQTPAALGVEIWEHYARNAKEGAAFSGAMNNVAALVAGEAVRVVDTSQARVVVDVGGATGTLLAALLRANTALSGVLLDLPHVMPSARSAMEALGCAARCELVGGDFFAHVPAGDIYLLKQVLHDWDDDRAVTILRNCEKSMNDGGRVLVFEMVIPDDGKPSPAELVDLNMLVMLPGRERTLAEYRALFERAGLRFTRLVETLSPFQIIEASRA